MPRTITLKDEEFAIVIHPYDGGEDQLRGVVSLYNGKAGMLNSYTITPRNTFDNNVKAKVKERYESVRTYRTNTRSMEGAIKRAIPTIAMWWSSYCSRHFTKVGLKQLEIEGNALRERYAAGNSADCE